MKKTMEKTAFISVLLSLPPAFTACTSSLSSVTPSGVHEPTETVLPSADSPVVSVEDVTYVELWVSAGGPPRFTDENDNVEVYYCSYSFYPDGRVEYEEQSYEQDVLYTDSWQKDSESITELTRALNDIGYFTLPDTIYLDLPYDIGSSTLHVYTEEDCIYCVTMPVHNSGRETDEKSGEIVRECKELFYRLIQKPLASEDVYQIAQ